MGISLKRPKFWVEFSLDNERLAFLAVISAALLAGCQNSGDAARALTVPGIYSGGDRHWVDVLDVIAADRGYFSRPDYEPKGAPYRTVMTYTKIMTKHDSITFLLAQDRSTKKHFVIVWDLPTQRRWNSEALQVKNVIAEQIGEENVRLRKAWMEHYSSNQSLQPTALWRCASMSILISVFSAVAQPRSPSGG